LASLNQGEIVNTNSFNDLVVEDLTKRYEAIALKYVGTMLKFMNM